MVAKTAAKLIASVEVTLGTHKAEVLYAGTSPGSIFGLTQVNFVVPPDLKFGGPLPVVVRVDGMTTQVADAFQGAVTLSAMGPSAPVPGTPKNLRANTTVDGGLATLKWTPADDLAALYYIEKHAGPACTFVLQGRGRAVPGNLTSTTGDPGPRSPVCYRIWAESDHGILSPYSLPTILNGQYRLGRAGQSRTIARRLY